MSKKGGGVGLVYTSKNVRIIQELEIGKEIETEDILGVVIEIENKNKI